MDRLERQGTPGMFIYSCRLFSPSCLGSCGRRARAVVWAGALLMILELVLWMPLQAQAEPPRSPARSGPKPGATTSPPPPPKTTGTLIPGQLPLVFRGNAGEVLGRTLSLQAAGGPVHAMKAVSGDLIEDQTGRAILSNKVSVKPAQAETIEDLETLSVTIDGKDVQPGSYKGEVRIYYREQAASPPLPIPVEAIFEAVPDVSVDASSVNQTLFAEKSFRDFPYVGRVNASTHPVLASLPVYLVQKANENATVEHAAVLAVTGPNGLVLPSGTVRVSTSLPLTLTPQGTKPLDLVVSGYNMPAGDYSGSLRVRVAKQDSVIDVPFKVKVRDGWLYPLLALLASFVVGLLVHWYNDAALSALGLVTDIKRRLTQLKGNPWRLQLAEKSKAGGLIALAMDAAQDQNTRPEAKRHIEAFDEFVKEQAEKTAEVRSRIETVKAEIGGLQVAFLRKVHDKLSKRIGVLETEMREGRTGSLDEARRLLDDVKADFETLKKLESVLVDVPKERRRLFKMDTAEDVAGIVRTLGDALLKDIEDLGSRSRLVKIGRPIREDAQNRLAQAKQELESSDTTKILKWASQIPEIEKQVQTLEKYFRFWQMNRDQLGADALKRLENAGSFEEIESILKERRPASDEGEEFAEAVRAGGSFSVQDVKRGQLGYFPLLADILDDRRLEAQPLRAEKSWTAYTFRMKFGVILVRILVYLFALLVGWATLYLGNDTFGARPEDYIALFLWGATINIISGQQIKFESILQHKDQKITATEEKTS